MFTQGSFLVISNAEKIVFIFKSGSRNSTRTSPMNKKLRVTEETFWPFNSESRGLEEWCLGAGPSACMPDERGWVWDTQSDNITSDLILLRLLSARLSLLPGAPMHHFTTTTKKGSGRESRCCVCYADKSFTFLGKN